jgi:hypothetical protein
LLSLFWLVYIAGYRYWLAAYAEYVFCLAMLSMVGGYVLQTCWLSLMVMLLFVA